MFSKLQPFEFWNFDLGHPVDSDLEPSATTSTTVSPSRTMMDCQDEFLSDDNEIVEDMEESVQTDSFETPEPPKALVKDHDYLKFPNESAQTENDFLASMPTTSQNG